MKKLFIMTFVLGLATSLSVAQGWTPVSKEQAEHNAIMLQVAQINEQFTACGASRSSARQMAIFQLLKNIGTPVSYKILQGLVASGQLDKSWLNAS